MFTKVNAKNRVRHNVPIVYKHSNWMFQLQGLCQLQSQPSILCAVNYSGKKTVHGAKFMTMNKNGVRNVKSKLL